MSYDYGHCQACGGTIEEKPVDHTVQAGGEWVLIRAVPTGVCTQCGEQILRWQVTSRLDEIVRHREDRKPEQCIQVPVFAFD